MKILTLNTWQERGPWRERWKLTLDFLDQEKPDLVCLQEVFNESWSREIQERTKYPSRVFYPEPSGLMMLSSGKVLDSRCLTLPTKSDEEEYLRYALYARIDFGKNEMVVFNTHLSWRLHEGPVREAQVKELLEFVQAQADGCPVIVTGDFNAPPETPEVRQMTASGFQDLFAAANPGKAGITWDNGRNPYAAGSSTRLPDRRIDYIFMQNGQNKLPHLSAVKVVLTEPDESGILASDHFGVMACFE